MENDTSRNGSAEECRCEARTVCESRSEPVKPTGRGGPVTVRMPVLVSETKIKVHIDLKIRLKTHIPEITGVQREALVTGCRLLHMGGSAGGRLSVFGRIRDDIQYVDSMDGEGAGVLRFLRVSCPFECTARVDYILPPVVKGGASFIPVELITCGAGHSDARAHHPCAHRSSQSSNAVFCEIEDIRIVDACMSKELPAYEEETPEEDRYSEIIRESLLISFSAILTQRQSIIVPGSGQY